jgi:hypothetical protein
MNSKRLYLVLLGVIAVLLLGLLVGAYNINKLLGSQATKLTAAKAQSMSLQQEQQSLIKAKQDIKSYTSLQQITEAVVPEDKNQAEAVREIVNIAAANGVSLASITFPASTLGAGVVPTTGSAATPAATPAPAAPSAASSPAATSTSPTTGDLSQLTPVANIPGVYQLAITVAGDSTKPVQYNQFIAFLSALEHNRRTAQVSSITLTPDSKDPNQLTFTLGISEYIKP